MSKMYSVRFNFIFDEENPIPCEFTVEADSYLYAELKGMNRMYDYMELCAISECSE